MAVEGKGRMVVRAVHLVVLAAPQTLSESPGPDRAGVAVVRHRDGGRAPEPIVVAAPMLLARGPQLSGVAIERLSGGRECRIITAQVLSGAAPRPLCLWPDRLPRTTLSAHKSIEQKCATVANTECP